MHNAVDFKVTAFVFDPHNDLIAFAGFDWNSEAAKTWQFVALVGDQFQRVRSLNDMSCINGHFDMVAASRFWKERPVDRITGVGSKPPFSPTVLSDFVNSLLWHDDKRIPVEMIIAVRPNTILIFT